MKKNTNRSAYYGYGTKPLNSKDKEVRHVVSETETQFTLNVPAFTGDPAKFIGQSKVTVYKADSKGLKAFKAHATLSDLQDCGRQAITDCRNNVAKAYEVKALEEKVLAGTATPAEILKVFSVKAKTNKNLAVEAEKLLKAMK